MSVPVIIIDGEEMVGFDRERVSNKLHLSWKNPKGLKKPFGFQIISTNLILTIKMYPCIYP
jgi:hypothetical protein